MRKFNHDLYDLYDHSGKQAIIKLFEKFNYSCISGETAELYSYCDLVFKHNDTSQVLKLEIEVKTKFDRIINNYPVLNVLPRKLKTKADYLIYIPSGETPSQFLILSTSFFKYFKKNIVEKDCSDHGETYTDNFCQIPKELAKWYIITKAGVTEMEFFDSEMAKQYS